MRTNNHVSPINSLPPKLPSNEAELHRTITLLGDRKQTELNARCRQELERLIGTYPTIKEAALWKRVLRRACRDAWQPATSIN